MGEVFLSVIVTELFAGLDGALGEDEDLVAFYLDFAVWTAGVVQIARDIFARGAVNGFAVANFEKILSANAVRLAFGDKVAPVFDDESTFWNSNVRKHA